MNDLKIDPTARLLLSDLTTVVQAAQVIPVMPESCEPVAVNRDGREILWAITADDGESVAHIPIDGSYFLKDDKPMSLEDATEHVLQAAKRIAMAAWN